MSKDITIIERYSSDEDPKFSFDGGIHWWTEDEFLYIRTCLTQAEINGMLQAKSRVLRRTEIPKDALNPTRDETVLLGEAIALIIQDDITGLTKQLSNERKKL